MITPPPTWPDILEHWRDPANPSDRQMFRRIARDLGVPSPETVRDWLKRNSSVPIVHWPRLIHVLHLKFGMVVTYRQLVEATIRVRLSRKSEAA